MREEMRENYVADDQDLEPSGKVSHGGRGSSRLTARPTWMAHPLLVASHHSSKIPRRLKDSKIDCTRIRQMLLGSMKKCTHLADALYFTSRMTSNLSNDIDHSEVRRLRKFCISKIGVIAKGALLPCFPEDLRSTLRSSSSRGNYSRLHNALHTQIFKNLFGCVG